LVVGWLLGLVVVVVVVDSRHGCVGESLGCASRTMVRVGGDLEVIMGKMGRELRMLPRGMLPLLLVADKAYR
jgi:hypothetical protein